MESDFAKKDEVLKDLYRGEVKITDILKLDCRTIDDARGGLIELVPVTQTFTEEEGKKVQCFVCRAPAGTVCYKLGSDRNPNKVMYAHKKCLGCVQCNRVAASYIIDDDRFVRCNNCGITCRACGGSFIGGSYLVALGRKWHYGCLVCAQCQAPLSEKCIEYQGKTYCPEEDALCLRKNFGLLCNKCGLQLDENCVKLAGKSFHKDCVSCSHCNESIIGLDFYPIRGQPYCNKCAKEFFSEV